MDTARYACEIDLDRRKAGWGEHWWVIDTTRSGVDRLLRLLPRRDAEIEANRLNATVVGKSH